MSDNLSKLEQAIEAGRDVEILPNGDLVISESAKEKPIERPTGPTYY